MISTDTVVGSGMKLTCSREDLVQRLAIVARGVSTRMAVQILAGIRLTAEGGTLALASTDMELSLRSSLEAPVAGEGAAGAAGRLLFDLARLLPESEVSFEHRPEEGVLRVECGSYSSRLNTYSVEDFPRLPEIEPSALHDVDRAAMLETVARVSRSASRDESRPVLTGILVRFEPGKLVMAATDSYRLAVKETPVSRTLPELEAIIPARALQELARIASSSDEIQLGVQDNHVVFGA